jgi:hypothetical protein
MCKLIRELEIRSADVSTLLKAKEVQLQIFGAFYVLTSYSLILFSQDCLAEGRSVSLPASAVGSAKLAVNAVGAYARLRKQFRVPIAEMGGVQVRIYLI